MATVPTNTICNHLGCKKPKLAKYSSCEEHIDINMKPTEQRIEHMEMYHNRAWRKKRVIQLSVQPLCQACLANGKVKQATVVDHVFPWAPLGKAFFTHNVFQSLCHECHSVKTGLEQKGVIRHYGHEVRDYTLADASTVIGGLI